MSDLEFLVYKIKLIMILFRVRVGKSLSVPVIPRHHLPPPSLGVKFSVQNLKLRQQLVHLWTAISAVRDDTISFPVIST